MTALTIFGRNNDANPLERMFDSLVGYEIVKHGNLRRAEAAYKLKSSVGTVDLNVTKHRQPGDQFSKMMLSTHNFFRVVDTPHEIGKKRVLDHVDAVEVIIGIVGKPDFYADDMRLDVVFSVARLVDGLIFNGIGMIDASGTLLLDREGVSELD